MDNKYLEIDFNNVEGFDQLTQEQQELFKSTYKEHNSIAGTEYKKGWIPIKVQWVEEKPIKYSYLKVDFKNGDWLHYTKKGWY
jgi:hypothetical protein